MNGRCGSLDFVVVVVVRGIFALELAEIPTDSRACVASVQVKVCGLTREEDVDLALKLGADFCGFILSSKSPRGLSLERAVELASRAPEGRRVLVDVETGVEDLKRYRDAGFDYFQIHAGLDIGTLAAWSGLVRRERLWIAPRLAPGVAFPEAALNFADTVLLDTYHKDKVGGTGETGDWAAFAELKRRYPKTNWALAGGLNPGNAREAIAATGAERIDLNSGVEMGPGIKNPEKLRELFEVLKP